MRNRPVRTQVKAERFGRIAAGRLTCFWAVKVPYLVLERAMEAPLNVTVFDEAAGAMISNEEVVFRSPVIASVLPEISTDRMR